MVVSNANECLKVLIPYR